LATFNIKKKKKKLSDCMPLISCVGKIMEQVIYKNVYNYLVRSKLIYEYQSGFQIISIKESKK
jgi:hypothetical protein